MFYKNYFVASSMIGGKSWFSISSEWGHILLILANLDENTDVEYDTEEHPVKTTLGFLEKSS